MSAPMIRAQLAGTKTQTRRAVKWRGLEPGLNLQFSGLSVERSGSNWVLTSPTRTSHEYRSVPMPCPYGQPGDRLWVRETARCIGQSTDFVNSKVRFDVDYKAGGGTSKHFELDKAPHWFPRNSMNVDGTPRWQPAIHMPRWASRITLEITGVRVERVQSISGEDAAAEGCPCYVCGRVMDGRSEDDCHCFHRRADARDYRDLWDSINGAGPVRWDANPFVWVVEFRRVQPC